MTVIIISKAGWTHLSEGKKKEPEDSCSSSSMLIWLRRVSVSTSVVHSPFADVLCMWLLMFIEARYMCHCSARWGHHLSHVPVHPETAHWGTSGVGVWGVQGNYCCLFSDNISDRRGRTNLTHLILVSGETNKLAETDVFKPASYFHHLIS